MSASNMTFMHPLMTTSNTTLLSGVMAWSPLTFGSLQQFCVLGADHACCMLAAVYSGLILTWA